MLRILVDENFNQRILRGVVNQIPNLDYIIVQKTELEGSDDPSLLAWAAGQQRVILTHDVNTVTKFAYDRIRSNEFMQGVIVVPKALAIGIAVEELAILIVCSDPEELENQVKYVPI